MLIFNQSLCNWRHKQTNVAIKIMTLRLVFVRVDYHEDSPPHCTKLFILQLPGFPLMIFAGVLFAAFLTVTPFVGCTSFDDIPSEVWCKIFMDYKSTPEEPSLKTPFNTCKRWRAVVTEYIESLDAAYFIPDAVEERLREFRIVTNWNDSVSKGFPCPAGSKFLTVTKNGCLLVDLWSIKCLNPKQRDRALEHIRSLWLVRLTWIKIFKFLAITAAYFCASYMVGARSSMLFWLSIPSLFGGAGWLKHWSMKPDEDDYWLYFGGGVSHWIASYRKHEIIPHHRVAFIGPLLWYQLPMTLAVGLLNLFNLSSLSRCLLGIPVFCITAATVGFTREKLCRVKASTGLSKTFNFLMVTGLSLLLERLLFRTSISGLQVTFTGVPIMLFWEYLVRDYTV